ncbi:hypothetical protein QZH41_000952 [Actinostola sp. cb2023]|nr:hypothetical protein QZH41_000952 [Actinostola sp. cb2023]
MFCERKQGLSSRPDSSEKPLFARNNGLPTLSLAVPFELIDENESKSRTVLITVTCSRRDHVYDPYLQQCRYGIVPTPRSEPFDTYRVRLFYKNSTRTTTNLREFKIFFIKEFSVYSRASSHIKYFNDKFIPQGLQFDISVQRIHKQSYLNRSRFQSLTDRLNWLLRSTEPFNITVNQTELTVYKVTYRILTCTNLQTYDKHEYAVLDGYMPAVYLNKSRETLPYHNYFLNGNYTIVVCKILLDLVNCTGAYVPFNNTEYTMLDNGSVYVNSIGEVLDKNEYDIIQGSIWICASFGNTFSMFYEKNNNSFTYSLLTFVCMLISIIALVFVLVTYSLFTELRTPPGINLMNLSISILLAQLLWILGSGQTDTPIACTVIAVLLHYFFLVSFVWTSIIAFDTWRAFTVKGRRSLADSKRKRLVHCLWYMAVGWLSVMVYVAICIAIDQSGSEFKVHYGSSRQCWIDNKKASLYLFAVPAGLTIVFNIVFYSMTVKAIRDTRNQTRLINDQSEKKRDYGVYVRIGSLMGFTWIFGFIAPFGWDFLWYPYIVLNGLQGVYIALAFGLNQRVRKHYADLVRKRRARTQESSTKSSLLRSNKRRSTSRV